VAGETSVGALEADVAAVAVSGIAAALDLVSGDECSADGALLSGDRFVAIAQTTTMAISNRNATPLELLEPPNRLPPSGVCRSGGR
jgi:hypothetical protein